MTKHPITPPPELVQQWWEATLPNIEISVKDQLCTQAAQWGADQELEACVEWTAIVGGAEALRAARRPKPPSLKEQALAALEPIERSASAPVTTNKESLALIRRALEQLND